MEINQLREWCLSALEHHGNKYLPSQEMGIACHYALFPPGKLFRPLMALASYLDSCANKELPNLEHDIAFFATSLEVHHTYTLIHDDLPCMDDDDMRRGKPSVHKQFNQWQAVLSGDALLSLSHGLLSQLESSQANFIRKSFSWALGVKGLILGQYLDLSGDMNESFHNIKRTHLLKTGRLIQMSLLGGQALAVPHNYQRIKETLRLGQAIGLSFQFIDDLSELSEDLSAHEREVNPWIHYPKESLQLLNKQLIYLKENLVHLPYQYKVLSQYMKKMKENTQVNLVKIQSQIPDKEVKEALLPMMAFF
jgi:geranylgeranyl pyrophosphate synthase